jgi:hypothetical protein
MRGVLLTALAGLLAVFAVASPKPASALPAATTAALNYSQPNADLVEVKKWYKRRYYGRPYYRPYRYYGRPYYRPYYRPYRYYGRPYYRPYYRPYGYYRRPRVSVWVGI